MWARLPPATTMSSAGSTSVPALPVGVFLPAVVCISSGPSSRLPPLVTRRAREPEAPLVSETSPRNVFSWPQSSICAVAEATEASPPISLRTRSWRVKP